MATRVRHCLTFHLTPNSLFCVIWTYAYAVDRNHPNLVCLTEIRIKPCITFTQLVHSTPSNYTFLSFPRKFSTKVFPAPNRRQYYVYVKLLFSYLTLYLISLPLGLNRPLLLANYRIQNQYYLQHFILSVVY